MVAAVLVERLLLSDAPLYLHLFLYLPAYFLVGYDVLWDALRNIVHGQIFDENFLMAIATVGAMALGFLPGAESEFTEAVFVMIVFQTGELFQSIAVGKSRRSIAALMDIRPETACALRETGEIIVSPDGNDETGNGTLEGCRGRDHSDPSGGEGALGWPRDHGSLRS